MLLLRDRVRPPRLPAPGAQEEAYLGIDIGSVSTNLVVLNAAGDVLHEIYVRTDGRPIEVVSDGLRTIAQTLGDRIRICGVGTTGSGRELIGELVGADTITDEITAHTTGAAHVARTLLGEPVDTIFEIGGQDAKFIAIEDGVVVDFAMNEACAAGTGSFLEEQAERLGVSIKEEFARLAFQSRSPVRLGERCTVFMEQDVNAWQQRGAAREDLVAGLAYSVALNYLHRVVRGRRIGRAIYFQGGTAYNDAVAAAFAGILGTRIIVPPHNGVIGAIGMALLAQEKVRGTGRATTFRGFDLEAVRYSLREFVCRALLQCLRHAGVHRRRGEDVLGRQVQRQIPQARPDRARAGDSGPHGAATGAPAGRLRRPRRIRSARRDSPRHVLPRSVPLLARLPGGAWLQRGAVGRDQPEDRPGRH